MTEPMTTSAILLAGGTGSRMRASIPKQYLSVGGKVVARHAFDALLASPAIDEVVVVCHEEYRHFFRTTATKPVHFASPGDRRQDSVYSGLQQVATTSDVVAIHDGARPLVTEQMLVEVIEAAKEHGAATVGMPLVPTVKLAGDSNFVDQTLDRERLWEIQTPQAVKADILRLGFLKAQQEALEVTDDVSLAELVGYPVKLIRGAYDNLKITTPTDLAVAETLLSQRQKATSSFL